jgi:hypothetical protein
MSNANELLRRALDYIDRNYNRGLQLHEEIHAYLAAEKEAEPVANYYAAKYVGDKYERAVTEWLRHPKQDCYLYTSPEPKRKPMTEYEKDEAFNSASKYAAWLETENRMLREARKPMTDEEIADEFGTLIRILRNGTYFIEGVFAGVRFAEKYHKIGDKDG